MCVETQRGESHLQAEGGASEDTDSTDTLASDF